MNSAMPMPELLDVIKQLIDDGYGDYPVSIDCDGDIYTNAAMDTCYILVDSSGYYDSCTLLDVYQCLEHYFGNAEIPNVALSVVVPDSYPLTATGVWVDGSSAYISC